MLTMITDRVLALSEALGCQWDQRISEWTQQESSSVRARSVPSSTWSLGGASTRPSSAPRQDTTVPVAPLTFVRSRQDVRQGVGSVASGSVCVEEWESVWTDHNDRFVLAVTLYRRAISRRILYWSCDIDFIFWTCCYLFISKHCCALI